MDERVLVVLDSAEEPGEQGCQEERDDGGEDEGEDCPEDEGMPLPQPELAYQGEGAGAGR